LLVCGMPRGAHRSLLRDARDDAFRTSCENLALTHSSRSAEWLLSVISSMFVIRPSPP
jgi:hypothetical protein